MSLVVLIVPLLRISKDGGCQQLGGVLRPIAAVSAMNAVGYRDTYDR